MKKNEFRPLPDEFNLGYIPPVREEEEEEKKKKQRRLRKLMIFAAAVFLILPLTLKTGLFAAADSGGIDGDDPSLNPEGSETAAESSGEEITEDAETEEKKVPDGTYKSASTYVLLDKGRGWFYNGEYFIPLHYDTEDLTYRAAGAFPESPGMALESTSYYVDSEGVIDILANGVRMYDPFTQQTSQFARVYAPMEISSIIQAFSPVMMERHIAGTWTGTLAPDTDYPMAYMTSLELSEGGGLSITVANTENDSTSVYSGSWTLEDGILKTSFDLPLKYEIVTSERTIECSFEQMPEGILYYTQDGCYLFLNIFSSQLFVHG